MKTIWIAAFWNRIALGALALSSASAVTCRADLQLSDAGRSRHQIVLPADAIAAEQTAARELQSYLRQITGAELPIVSETAPERAEEILVGNSGRLKSLAIDLPADRFGAEGFLIKTAGAKLILAGGRPRGTLYAVYQFLETNLGVRWFTPEVERAPKQPSLRVADLDEFHRPQLEYREVFWSEILRSPVFAARHRLNGQHYALDENLGGKAAVYFPFVHSFDLLIPRELYGQHPEYFPLINGRRADGYVQRCLSNPDVLQIAIHNVRQWLKEHPDATIISVSQNDTGHWCQCAKCKALDDAEGSPSASIIRFVNAIAENIEKDYPKVRIDTLAYQFSRKPPRTLRPRRNVIIRLCSIECCFGHPLATGPSPENQKFRADILAWQPVAPTLYIWDYTPNFAHYQQPFPNFDALQPNVQFFVQHGVTGLFEQGNYSPGGHGEMEPLRAYLLARLLWNPATDIARDQQEFLEAYYGSDASLIRAYLDLIHQPIRQGLHLHLYDPPTAAYLKPELISKADALLQTAEENAASDEIRRRVEIARLPVWFVQISDAKPGDPRRRALLEKFLAVARQAGVSHISEGQSLGAWAKAQGEN